MPTATVTAQNRMWKEQDDANILASAQEIMKDKRRLAGAKRRAKIMAIEQEKNLKSIKNVAGIKPKK